MRGSFEERFWAKVDVRPEGQCWEWTGYKDKDGYGQIGFQRKLVRVHRVSAFIHGLIGSMKGPSGGKNGFVLHHCDNPSCCNPWHLEVGTQKKNAHDAFVRGRREGRKGEAHSLAKLTEQDVIKIRREYAAGGVRQVDLARKYGVDKAQIGRAIRRDTWGHV